ncbi:ABC transporter substrate-binding protein [Arthrobacter sp. SA17]
MRIRHAFGTTEIDSEPQRVATLGLASNDICLALGVVPFVMPHSGVQANGSTPWFDLAWRKFGLDMPRLVDESKGAPVDELTDMEPDLIIAVNSRMNRNEYHQLSRIAPVIAFPGDPGDTEWRTSLAMVGKALGRSQQAEKVQAETEQSIARELGSYPDLAGTEFLFSKVRAALGADFQVFDERSNPVRILSEFGLKPAASLALVREQGRALKGINEEGETYTWPQVRSGELSSDIAVFSVVHGEAEEIEENDTLADVPAYRAGNFVIAESTENGLALDTASCLSLQWIARNMLPELARAAYGAKKGE